MATKIVDDKIKPYFIKIVNSNYEVHQAHKPKDPTKKEYTKFICSKSTIYSALIEIAKRKLSLKRRSQKVVALVSYLEEMRQIKELVMAAATDDSVENQVLALSKKVKQLNTEIEKLKKIITLNRTTEAIGKSLVSEQVKSNFTNTSSVANTPPPSLEGVEFDF